MPLKFRYLGRRWVACDWREARPRSTACASRYARFRRHFLVTRSASWRSALRWPARLFPHSVGAPAAPSRRRPLFGSYVFSYGLDTLNAPRGCHCARCYERFLNVVVGWCVLLWFTAASWRPDPPSRLAAATTMAVMTDNTTIPSTARIVLPLYGWGSPFVLAARPRAPERRLSRSPLARAIAVAARCRIDAACASAASSRPSRFMPAEGPPPVPEQRIAGRFARRETRPTSMRTQRGQYEAQSARNNHTLAPRSHQRPVTIRTRRRMPARPDWR